jgi:membrane protein
MIWLFRLLRRTIWLFRQLRRTVSELLNDDALTLSAALAYYGVFSIPPLLIIVLAVASVLFGEKAAQGRIMREIAGTVGEPVAVAIQGVLQSAHRSGAGWLASLVAGVTLLFVASGAFVQLQHSLNIIWKVRPHTGPVIYHVLIDRVLSLLCMLATGLLLLFSVVVTSALVTLGKVLSPGAFPGGLTVWQVTNAGVAFIIITILFAMMFKILPDATVRWGDVWLGATVTGLLFTAGKYCLGLYLSRASVVSAYGAAGSLVVIMLWVYYSSLIMLFGAELARVYAESRGHAGRPKNDAERTYPQTATTQRRCV